MELHTLNLAARDYGSHQPLNALGTYAADTTPHTTCTKACKESRPSLLVTWSMTGHEPAASGGHGDAKQPGVRSHSGGSRQQS